MYNLTNFTGNETGLLTVTQAVNSNIMGGMLGNLFMIGIAVVIYIAIILSSGDNVKAGMTTGFIGFVLSLSLLAVDLVHPLLPYAFLMISAIHIALAWKG